jgi:uracil-DNA glycosylase
LSHEEYFEAFAARSLSNRTSSYIFFSSLSIEEYIEAFAAQSSPPPDENTKGPSQPINRTAVVMASDSKYNGSDVKNQKKGGGANFRGAVDDLLLALTDPSWKQVLQDAVTAPSFYLLALFLTRERNSGVTVYPPRDEIFAAFNLCPLASVKVVIVGQDPSDTGHGLAFSVRRGVPPSPSLVNVLQEAGVAHNATHGNLETWARQGVLLLNTVLTVRRGQRHSHANKGWEDFTDAVVDVMNRKRQGLVFLLWGRAAHNMVNIIDESRHTIICTSHPSPWSASKTSSPFIGSRCFQQANEVLIGSGLDPIDWSLPNN